ncbi:hypothetical protein A2Z33_00545 [Candidatus Gottesmanbacteria bacterium RBG_16_52_11]|uniref:Uncharacterized protein n=1 Tax=Candidatus Gottesmanbacteria bacterium RBG_16_52_11 TaxID=1798374 RepID=A0A1F5YMV1_9BACT|nr:MAG: hypothetical protein A2Z33_00545 [Candidatus Gottesmanbacteria bacterium RBG_16_52_11]
MVMIITIRLPPSLTVMTFFYIQIYRILLTTNISDVELRADGIAREVRKLDLSPGGWITYRNLKVQIPVELAVLQN